MITLDGVWEESAHCLAPRGAGEGAELAGVGIRSALVQIIILEMNEIEEHAFGRTFSDCL